MDLSALNIRRWFLIVFALSCLGLNVIAYILYLKNQEVVKSKDWVSHTYEVIAAEYNLFSSLQDMETAQRGYLLTVKNDYLDPFTQSNKVVDTEYNNLVHLTADNPSQQDRLMHFRPVIEKHRDLLLQQISKKRAGNSVPVTEVDANKAVMDQLRGFNAQIIADEKQLLAKRVLDQKMQQQSYVEAIFLSAGMAILGLLLANGVILFLTLRRQAAEADLIRINKEMEGFTYIASHDLRSPLVNLKGFSSEMRYGIDELRPILETVLKDAPEEDRKKVNRILEEDISDALRYIHSSVEKMDKLTNAILELSRIGRRPLKLEWVNANKIVQDILNTLHHQITTKGITVKVNSLPDTSADILSLEQIFGNVIDNAIKYLDPSRPGQIEIGGSRNYRETTYWVKDNGRGIMSGDMQKIFEIYRRGGNNEKIPGEGMGMAYVRATLRRLSGTIWADSKEGEGTTFYFTISNTLKKEA